MVAVLLIAVTENSDESARLVNTCIKASRALAKKAGVLVITPS